MSQLTLDAMPNLAKFYQRDHGEFEIMDFNELHGFLTATAISPVPLEEDARNSMIFDLEVGNPFSSDQEAAVIYAELDAMDAGIQRMLSDDALEFELPCDVGLTEAEDCPIKLWSEGFMVGYTILQALWEDETPEIVEDIMKLTLPMLMASGWFDEAMEDDGDDEGSDLDDITQQVAEIKANPALVEDMCVQIPDVVSELYLLIKLGGSDA